MHRFNRLNHKKNLKSESAKLTFLYVNLEFFNKVTPFLLSILLSHYLVPADYAKLELYSIVFGLSFLFISFNQNTYLSISTVKQNLNENILATVVVNAVNSIFVCLFLAVIELNVFQYDWLVIPLASFMFSMVSSKLTISQFSRNIKMYGFIQISIMLLSVSLTLILVIWIGLGVNGRLISIITPVLAVGSLCFFLLVIRPKLFSIDYKKVKESYKFGVSLFLHNIISGWAKDNVAKIVILNAAGAAALGKFGLVFLIASSLNIFFNAVNLALMPELYESVKSSKSLAKLKKVFSIYIALTIISGFLAPSLMRFVLDSQYHDFIYLVPILFFAFFFNSVSTIYANLNVYLGMGRYVSKYSFLSVSLYFSLSCIFIEGDSEVLLLAFLYMICNFALSLMNYLRFKKVYEVSNRTF